MISIKIVENFKRMLTFFVCCFYVMYMRNLFHNAFNMCNLFCDAFNKKSFQLKIPIGKTRDMT